MRPAQDNETGRAGAEHRGGHPGRVGAQGGSCSTWAQGLCVGRKQGEGKRRRREKKMEKKEKREREEKEKDTPAGFAVAVASACNGFGEKRHARNDEEQGRRLISVPGWRDRWERLWGIWSSDRKGF